MFLGAPLPGFIYATGLRFYKCPSRIRIRLSFLRLQVNLRVLVPVHLLNGSDPVYESVGYPKGISMSVAPETLLESQTRIESPNFKSSTSSIL
jgi:hypothetical protein